MYMILGLILLLVSVILLMFNTYCEDSDKRLVVSFVTLFFIFACLAAFYELIYKQGQVDALTGKARYKLEIMDDSTRVWTRIQED